MQINAFVLLCTVAPVTAVFRGTNGWTLLSEMQPEVVSTLLKNVEEKWIHDRAMVLANATNDEEAFADMQKSCVKISSAIVEGSEGQKDRVTEYMQDVCAANGGRDEKGICAGFASGVEAVMTDDPEFNRDALQLSQFCRKFWENTVTAVAQSEAKERAEQAEKERIEQEKLAKEKAAVEAQEKAAEEAREKVAQEKAAEEAARNKAAAEEAAQVKAYETQEAAKAKIQANDTSAKVQTNDTSVDPQAMAIVSANETSVTPHAPSQQANATDTPVGPSVVQESSDVEQMSNISSAPAAPGNSTDAAGSALEGTGEKKNSSSFVATGIAVAETPISKTSNTSVAKITIKNTKVAHKK